MRKLLFIALFITTLANAEVMKPFELPIYNESKTFKLSEHKGKIVVINFWASWCIACIAEFKELNQLKEKYPAVTFVAVNAGEEKNKITKLLRKHTFNYLILEDLERKFSKSVGVEELPRTLIIDSTGTITYNAKVPPKTIP